MGISFFEHEQQIYYEHLYSATCLPAKAGKLYLRYASVPLLSLLGSAVYLFSSFIEADD
jgi:hypothetical protein